MAALSDAAYVNSNYGRLARNLGLAFCIVAAIIWLQGALAAIIIILLAAILYRLARPAPGRGAASLSPPSTAPERDEGYGAVHVLPPASEQRPNRIVASDRTRAGADHRHTA